MFPSQLSNDATDRFNHKWMVLQMLVLALVSFIVPLHPHFYNNNKENHDNHNNNNNNNVDGNASPPAVAKLPTYTAVCWTPAQFTNGQILFANSFCGSQFNAAIRGSNETSVYELMMHEMIPLPDQKKRQIEPFLQKHSEEIKRVHDFGEDLKSSVTNLVTFQVPLALFLVAVGLTLSQVVWGILGELFGCFSLEATLATANSTGAWADASSRTQLYEEIAESLTLTTSRCPRTLSVLYLVKKILSVVVVLSLAIVLIVCCLPKVDNLQTEADDFASMTSDVLGDSTSDASTTMSMPSSPSSTSTPSSSDKTALTETFICDMYIRMLQTVQTYALQCFPVLKQDNFDNKSPSSSASSSSSSSTFPSRQSINNLLEFDSMVLHVASTLLIVLLVANVFSLCSWMLKLMSNSSRSALSLRDSVPTDVVLLLQMAHANTGALVATMLARGFGGAKV